MLDAWIIDRIQQPEKTAHDGIPLYAPTPPPPSLREEPAPLVKPTRGVAENLDKEFLI